MIKAKPVVGQIVYSLNIGNAARTCEQKLTKMIVKRVERTKFYCVPAEHPTVREVAFFIDGWGEDSRGYRQSHRLYETEQEWADEIEINSLSRFIHDSFEYGRNRFGVPLAALLTIKGIIEGNKKP